MSRICESLDDAVAGLQGRDLPDAACVKCREGRLSFCALVAAAGAGADGYRRLLGLDAIDTEPYAGWPGVSQVACGSAAWAACSA